MSLEQLDNNPEQEKIGVYAEGLKPGETFEIHNEELENHIESLEAEIKEIESDPERKGGASLNTMKIVLDFLKKLQEEKDSQNKRNNAIN